MTSNEWESNVDNMPHGVTSPDLFGGELFGDELIDIYSAEGIMDSAIPALLGAAVDASSKTPLPDDHPDAQMAMAAAAMDDGFGSLRPSTSFSDFTGLAVPVADGATSSATAAVAISTVAVATKAKPAPKKTAGKKRAASGGDGPAAKKRGGAKARAPSTAAAATKRGAATKTTKATTTRAPKTQTQSAGQAALKLRKEQRALLNGRATKTTNGTPNPLISVPTAKPTSQSKIAPKVKPATVLSSVTLPAGIAPKSGGTSKGDSITSEAAAATAAAAAVAAAVAVSKTAVVPPPVPSSIAKGRATTEADFKSVAQAAVTNLILNAGSAKQKADAAASAGRPEPGSFNGKVDTSTEHIKNLTSSNWVNACGGGEHAASAQAAADAKANNRARRQNLTPDERARQNRDRNREHARNTRLRKKAYVEELKRTLTELVSQRDAAELEKRQAAQREMEQREVRFRVMEEFLKLRGRSETNLARWVAILEDNFSLTLPNTPYRKMVHRKSSASTEQVLKGASEVMADASYVADLLDALNTESKANVAIIYLTERKNFFMDGSSAVLDFSASVVGQLTIKGIMRAKFSPASNKLISAELIFDANNAATLFGNMQARTSTGKCDEVAAAAAAAQVAAHEADALLDSIQMPALKVPANISLEGTKESHSVTCSESSDESTTDVPLGPLAGVVARRSARQKL